MPKLCIGWRRVSLVLIGAGYSLGPQAQPANAAAVPVTLSQAVDSAWRLATAAAEQKAQPLAPRCVDPWPKCQSLTMTLGGSGTGEATRWNKHLARRIFFVQRGRPERPTQLPRPPCTRDPAPWRMLAASMKRQLVRALVPRNSEHAGLGQGLRVAVHMR